MFISMSNGEASLILNAGEKPSTGDFRRLYETVFPILFRVAYRITSSEEAAEDLCQ